MFRTAIVFAVGWALVCHNREDATYAATSSGMMERNSAISEWNSGRIKGPDGYIYYEDNGTGGIPVVLLHSFGGSSIHWKAQVEHLQKERRVVTIDLRGHGKSDTSATQDYAIESLAKDVAAVVDSLRLTRFVLAGHSIGGSVAIAYAGLHPEKVAGLLVAGAPGKSTEEQAKPIIASLESEKYRQVMDDYMKKLLAGARPEVDSLVTQGTKRLSKPTTLSLIKAAFRYDPVPALSGYSGPKLIVSTPEENQANALARQVPGVPVSTIAGTSHWIQMDKPDAFNRILDAFLKIVEGKGN